MVKRPRRKFGRSQKDRIFFACFPDAETASRIHALAEQFRRDKSLEGTLILPEHLHVTLFHLGDWHSLPEQIVDIAKTAAAQVEIPPFEATFNRAGNFHTRTGHYPFVLTGYRLARQWQPLETALGAALKRAGLGAATQSEFKPHVTLLRDELRVTPFAIAPISWTVVDFVLVHSLLGKTTHVHLGRWPLRAA
jgi:2'-5' RNA ligase